MTDTRVREYLPEDECLEWEGSVSPEGYGRVGSSYMHRVAYEKEYGPIPAGSQIDHLCRNRRCVKPSHLEAVDQYTNIMRGMGPSALHAAQEVCVRGHEFDLVRVSPTGRRWRVCSQCRTLRNRARYRKAEA